jgi:hypothetical protein
VYEPNDAGMLDARYSLMRVGKQGGWEGGLSSMSVPKGKMKTKETLRGLEDLLGERIIIIIIINERKNVEGRKGGYLKDLDLGRP